MAISLNPEKANANLKKIEHFEANSKAKIRELASVIGSLISLFPAVPPGKLHYEHLEKIKSNALRLKRGNFKVRPSKLDALSHEELNWWKKGDPKCL